MTSDRHLYMTDREVERRRRGWRRAGYCGHMALVPLAITAACFGLSEHQPAFWTAFAVLLAIALALLLTVHRMAHWTDVAEERLHARERESRRQDALTDPYGRPPRKGGRP